MIAWNLGMTMESIQERIATKAMEIHKQNEKKVCESLDISEKELNKILNRIMKKEGELKKSKEIEKQRNEEFVIRSRGKAIPI